MIRSIFSSKFWYGRFIIALPIFALGIFTISSSAESHVIATQSQLLPAVTSINPQRVQAQANFFAADIDKNEQLSLSEFMTFINLNAEHNLGQAASIRQFKMYKRAFKRADANGDGILTKQEIAAQAKE
jgi:Ca2+-binding EF-hand superfamily protein